MLRSDFFILQILDATPTRGLLPSLWSSRSFPDWPDQAYISRSLTVSFLSFNFLTTTLPVVGFFFPGQLLEFWHLRALERWLTQVAYRDIGIT